MLPLLAGQRVFFRVESDFRGLILVFFSVSYGFVSLGLMWLHVASCGIDYPEKQKSWNIKNTSEPWI